MSALLVQFEYLNQNVKETDQHRKQIVVEVLEVALLGQTGEYEFGKRIYLDVVLEFIVIRVLFEMHVCLFEAVLQYFE